MEDVKIEEEVKETEVGEVLDLTADEDNPVNDGLEFREV